MNEKTLKALEYNKIIKLLIDKAESTLGKAKVKEVLPLTNKEDIEFLQRQTEEALKILLKKGNPPLFGINSVAPEVRRVEIGGSLTPGGLIKISDSLRVSRSLKTFMKGLKDDKVSNFPIIEGLIDNLKINKHLEDEINNAIISENEISDNASSALRSIRRQIINKNNSVKDKLNALITSQSHKKYLQDSIVTIREGRYVVPVKQENKGSIPGVVHDMSSSGATVFVEPMAVVRLNNELRELEVKEREEIERILKVLSNLVGEDAEGILENQNILQEIDFIFAKGKLALDMNATKPVLNEDGYINIKKARHPLLKEKEVVPVDVYIGKDFNSLVITGPNTGGKTVTLKTVGLLTLMAQSGIHIPADFNSQIGVFNQVFADIGDEQSIEQSLSTFSSHMVNIVDILDKVEYNSLLLFDELGAGTDPTEGAALAMSILDHLLKLNVRVIATTHYSQLKLYALTTEGVNNASVEFDVETLSPTFKVLIGVPGKSNAFEISSRLGLQDYIIDYARELISKENVEFEDVLQVMEEDRLKAERNRQESERNKLEIEKLRESLSKEKNKVEGMREKILSKAKEEARDILRKAKDDADHLVGELREISSEIERDRNRKIEETRDKLKTELEKSERQVSSEVLNVKSSKPPKNLKEGETVEVLTFNQKGTVIDGPDENGNVRIQVGIMKINAHISTLKRATSDATEKAHVSTKKIMSSKSRDIKTEIDLRGKNLDEAFLELDKYIDDAYLAGLKQINIIHGKGTGVLRTGIQGYLKTHRNVKSHRLGVIGEGGDGVTIVEMK
ncbi:MAG TPA: endonuclease MutS2 [Tissierellaceae bacterium]|nr:endonuclease MutS2 [Tissierellaceae bacterium]